LVLICPSMDSFSEALCVMETDTRIPSWGAKHNSPELSQILFLWLA